MAVADALVSKVVDMLVSTIAQEFRLLAGVEEEVRKLTLSLQSIQAVLIDAERRKRKEATVELWLDRLKSVAYDIDDVVDEWSYEILSPHTEREEDARKARGKVHFFIRLLSACYCSPMVVSRHRIAIKISELNSRLDVISIEKDRYGFQLLRSNVEQVERSITTSDISILEVKGRDVDKEKLVSMVLSGSNEMSNVRLIPVVGMGGIGKTTLVRLVYNDERVKSHFHKRIWVCVSDPFDEVRIAKEILEYLLGATNLVSLSNIMEKIKDFIKGKKILLVLDDVWNENPKKWKQLEDCLESGSPGNCILVTTRNEKVGRVMGCLELDIFRIGLLSEDESWELFCMIAFSRKSSEERASLEKLGREVVGRCKDLPLAIRAIAGLLQFKNSRREWQSVIDSELWGLEEVNRDIVGPLLLSYYDLPSPLKQCFSYCAVFPKDYQFEKYELINHWIGQGYIGGTHSKDMEIIGEEYFDNLAMRSFFHDIEVNQDQYNITRTWCKMHDIVHDFAQLQVKKECLILEVCDGQEIRFNDSIFSDSLRHLNVTLRGQVQCLDSFYNLKKLHSLIVSSAVLDLQKIFTEFTLLRSLIMRNCGIVEVPSNISRLIHLRELDLSNNDKLVDLPSTIWELHNLQIFNLKRTKLRSVKGVERLSNLRHLGNYGTTFFLPKEMVRLSSLRLLERINIDVNNEEAFSLKHLKNFNQLGGSLVIKWSKRSHSDVEDAKQAHLQDKKHITILQLYMRLHDMEVTKNQDEELLEALNVPPNLEFLRIYLYRGSRTPNWWASLSLVKMVDLDGWENFEHLPPFGILPCLERLRLWRFSRVVVAGAQFLGMDTSKSVPMFPRLTYLLFSSFDNWEEWDDVDEDETLIMPSLTYLEIYSCMKLKSLPKFILKKTALKLKIHFSYDLEKYVSQWFHGGEN